MRRLWFVLALLAAARGYGAFELDIPGPRATAMGGAGAALRGDVWCGSRNPALIARHFSGVGTVWSRQFGLPELTREAAIGATSVRGQPFAIRVGNFVSDLYREGEIGIAIARRLRPELSAGLELAGRWLDICNYPSARALSVTAGIAVEPVEGIAVGAVWRNLNRPRLSGYADHLSEILTVGVAASVGELGAIVADIVQEERFPAEYRIGAESELLPHLFLRVGARAEPVRPSAGFRVSFGCWSLEYAGDLHPDLGPSHEIGLDLELRP
ncbi:hypothetical protein KKH27_06925 [bacterium]|nr:hypothetical protein [bacterium]MBU1985233.1 hypothetical protein [bacterium]